MKIKFAVFLIFSACLFQCKEDVEGPHSQDFNVENEGANLAARLWLPGSGKYPVVINVEGSSTLAKESFANRAEFYNENGMAVLAYDKRGFFKSTGARLTPTTANSIETFGLLSSDLLAIVAFLKNHPNIEGGKIGLICSDQGVWIGTLAQASNSDISCAINLLGTATSVGVQEYYSQLAKSDANGNNLSSLSAAEIDALVSGFNGFHGFDPLPYLQDIGAPQFWLMGGVDFRYPTRQSVAILNNLISSKGRNIEIVVEPNANHVLFDVVNNKQLLQGDLLAAWFMEKFF